MNAIIRKAVVGVLANNTPQQQPQEALSPESSNTKCAEEEEMIRFCAVVGVIANNNYGEGSPGELLARTPTTARKKHFLSWINKFHMATINKLHRTYEIYPLVEYPPPKLISIRTFIEIEKSRGMIRKGGCCLAGCLSLGGGGIIMALIFAAVWSFRIFLAWALRHSGQWIWVGIGYIVSKILDWIFLGLLGILSPPKYCIYKIHSVILPPRAIPQPRWAEGTMYCMICPEEGKCVEDEIEVWNGPTDSKGRVIAPREGVTPKVKIIIQPVSSECTTKCSYKLLGLVAG